MLPTSPSDAVSALRVFIVCDQDATAPNLGVCFREKGFGTHSGNIRPEGHGTFHGGDSGFDRDRYQRLPCRADGRWAEKDTQFWYEAASATGRLFKKTINGNTGLAPDYAKFNGTSS